MEYGIALPNYPAGASREGIEAGAEVAARLGWTGVWTTDHLVVNRAHSATYGRIFETLVTLAWVGGRHPAVRLGTSVIVVPQRNAVVLAKELATLDALSGGRVIAGVGVGWNEDEFGNVGAAERFRVRGAYLDETIALWRHLWAGSGEPFRGRFHELQDYVFEPLPVQGAGLPIWVGGGSDGACRRAGTLADAWHASAMGPASYAKRVPKVLAAAKAAGRPAPALTARVRIRFGDTEEQGYVARGTPEQIASELRAFANLGVTSLVLAFGVTDPEGTVRGAERFAQDVAPLV